MLVNEGAFGVQGSLIGPQMIMSNTATRIICTEPCVQSRHAYKNKNVKERRDFSEAPDHNEDQKMGSEGWTL